MNRKLKQIQWKKYVKRLGNAVSALSILFVIAALFQIDYRAVKIQNIPLFVCVCLVGLLLKTATVFFMGTAWRRWLSFFSGKPCDGREAMRVYVKSNIGKYLPGNVMHYVERSLFAQKLCLTQRQLIFGSAFEVCGLVLAAFLVGVPTFFANRKTMAVSVVVFHGGSIGIYAFAGALLIAVAAGIFLCKKAHARPVKSGFVRTFFCCFFTYLAVLIMLGVIFVCIYWYFAGMPAPAQAALMVAAYITAWVCGFVVPGAPGGIGVRELVLTLLLSPVMGQDIVVTIGIVHRLITVLGDFAAYVLGRALIQRQ